MNDGEITWGDTVRVKGQALAEFRPGSLAAVCGFRKATSGEILILIEFPDGQAVEIPKELLVSYR